MHGHVKTAGIKAQLGVCLILVLLLAGCASFNGTQAPTDSILIAPSATPVTPAITQIPLTNTPVPTLPVDEQDTYVVNLIATNGGCELPCILGIQPGQSTWQDVREIEAQIWAAGNINPGEAALRYGLSFSFTEASGDLFDMVSYGSGSNIEHISASAFILLQDDPYRFPPFAEAMRRFSLKSVLNEHGPPSRVLLHIQGELEPGGISIIEIVTIYENSNFIVRYVFYGGVSRDPQTDKQQICPKYEFISAIKMYSKVPEITRSLKSLAGIATLPLGWYTDWERLTGLSIEEFQTVFAEDDDSSCVMLLE